MKRLSTTLKVRLISNFLQLIITTAFIPFIALYLTDMLNQSIVGIYLVVLVILKFPLSIISGYIIEIFPKKVSRADLSVDDGCYVSVNGHI